MTDALAMEDGSSAYVNVLVCKEGNENEPKIKALVAALQSQQVQDFMDENYKGAVVSVVENPTDGYDSSIDYDALNGETVSCAATPAPHCEVLEICKDLSLIHISGALASTATASPTPSCFTPMSAAMWKTPISVRRWTASSRQMCIRDRAKGGAPNLPRTPPAAFGGSPLIEGAFCLPP